MRGGGLGMGAALPVRRANVRPGRTRQLHEEMEPFCPEPCPSAVAALSRNHSGGPEAEEGSPAAPSASRRRRPFNRECTAAPRLVSPGLTRIAATLGSASRARGKHFSRALRRLDCLQVLLHALRQIAVLPRVDSRRVRSRVSSHDARDEESAIRKGSAHNRPRSQKKRRQHLCNKDWRGTTAARLACVARPTERSGPRIFRFLNVAQSTSACYDF
jgi:hypothetical protein